MFDLSDASGRQIMHYESPIPATPADTAPPAKASPLDGDAARELHGKLLDFYVQELERQEANRLEQATDEDFYDNIQWKDSDKAQLESRGQLAIVYNVIATTLNWVIGTERRGRADYKVLPRRKEMAKPAEKKSALLKYLSDVNRTPFHRSRGFEDSVKVGVGWLEDGIEDDSEGEPLFSRYESWRNLLWDSSATELDLKDGRYMFRPKWVDVDIMKALFPERAQLLDESIDDGDRWMLSLDGDEPMDSAEHDREQRTGFGNHRNVYTRRLRVRVIEGWFTRPVKTKRVKGGDFHGELFDQASPGHVDAVNSGEAEIAERVTMRMYVALFTSKGLICVSPSPYRHNKYPFTPIWCYRRGKDGLPYGMVRGLRGMQEDINKRASKALHILSSFRVVMDEGAVEDLDALAEEVHRPDAVIVKRPGKQLEIDSDRELVEGHFKLLTFAISMVQQSSGVTDENRGLQTNATSGVAIGRRQDQGATTTTKIFDNQRLAFQIQGEKQLANIEQFMSEAKQFRITNLRGTPEFISVNDGLPENDIVRSKADFVISEADWRASVRQAQADELIELVGKLAPVNPQLAMVMIDLVVEAMDLPSRDELVKRIRQVTGQRDPDAGEPTPEEAKQMQAQMQRQQLQDALQTAMLRKTTAEAAATEAKAKNLDANSVKANIASMGGPKRGGLDIAVDLMTAPELAAVADEILKQAGFVSRAEAEQMIQTAIAQAQQQQQQQQAPQPPPQQQQQPQPPATPAPQGA